MNKNIDYYKILQVHHDAGQDIIDAAYRCLSKIYHPDLNKNPMAAERMKSINIAYGIIGNDRKRKEYHIEWLKNNNISKPQETVIPRNKENNEEEKIKLAKAVLDEFFNDTVNENWDKAYQKLTSTDKTNIPVEDFLEWKKTVAKVYKLGNYKSTYFRKYHNCDYAGVVYSEIFHFSVSLTEMQVVTGKTSEEMTQKYVVYDQDGWKICLGYTDLKPTITKFRYLAEALPKVDKDEIFRKAITKIDPLTGMLSHNGFVEQAEREMLRSQRYGNPLSLAVITIEPIENDNCSFEDNQLDACISYVSNILCENIRKTDIIGRNNDSSFVILFTETKLDEAKEALSKLLDLSEADAYLEYKIFSECTDLNKGNIEKIIKVTLEKAALNEKSKLSSNQRGQSEHLNAKLGKYKASDILGFNRKGKNHF